MRFDSHMQSLVNDPEIGSRIDKVLEKPISASEKEILESLKKYFSSRNGLTAKQFNYFVTIEARYSEERIAASQEWITNFDEEKRSRLKLAVEYYKHTRYFGDLVNLLIRNPEYIPTERQYNSFCKNAYFEKALENYNTPPAFQLCDLVTFRESARRINSRGPDFVGMIEEVSDRPSFTKGDRRYLMLHFGENERTWVSESMIKLYREKKTKKE